MKKLRLWRRINFENHENNLPKIFYWCGIELTKDENKREHVPPLGFFPKGYRNNLIRVPSCEKHNNNFPALDEKFQFYLKAHKSYSSPQSLDSKS